MKKERKIAKIITGQPAVDGAGVHLTRVLNNMTVNDFDPFLMLDSFDSGNPNEYLKGFPWHPHRGIETVTYLRSGKMEHQDSLGNKGLISDNQAQWMSASSGILPQATEHLLGFQLWINLPSDKKMDKPKYNDLDPAPYKDEDMNVEVISGEYKGVKGFNPDYVKATILIVDLKPNAIFEYDVPEEDTLFVFTLQNGLIIDNQEVSEKRAVLLTNGNHINLKANQEGCLFALFTGKPLKQPIAWGGPIVMNTREELNQAFIDLENNEFILEDASYVTD